MWLMEQNGRRLGVATLVWSWLAMLIGLTFTSSPVAKFGNFFEQACKSLGSRGLWRLITSTY